ncbi:MAG: hypothetical protein D6765_06135 [Bacteroidetes bacterium]|nr:MAG: hypothetical protein D6765_06135 [Bacteroidota bacterium]
MPAGSNPQPATSFPVRQVFISPLDMSKAPNHRALPAFLAGLFLFLARPAGAQVPPLYPLPDDLVEIYRQGEQALLQKDWQTALRHFKRVNRKKPDFAPALRGIGACYELAERFDKAAATYEEVLQKDPYFSRVLYFECGRAYLRSGNYFMALRLLEEFQALQSEPPGRFPYNGVAEAEVEKKYLQQVEQLRSACHIALDSIKYWSIPAVDNLGPAINTPADEYFPYLTNDGQTLFYTSRRDPRSDENLYFSTRSGKRWRAGQPVGHGFNTTSHEGMLTLVRNGNRAFFTACGRPEVLGTCDLWEARRDGKALLDPHPLDGRTNSPQWESQASISCDGNLLFFASNRHGGEGGTDIWMARRMMDGRWGEPINLGPPINTPYDEEAPFITNDGKVLYFSSTGHPGLGEEDIFMSRLQPDGKWGPPVNLGVPVNSAYRELGFFLSADGKTGYFASNRTEGFGGMDIYRFELSEQLAAEPITFLRGQILDSVLGTPVQTTVWFESLPPLFTEPDGSFFLCAPAGRTLHFEILHNDYHPYRGRLTVPPWDNRQPLEHTILLQPTFQLPVLTQEAPPAPAPQPKAPPPPLLELRHEVFFDFDDDELKTDQAHSILAFLSDVLSGRTIHEVEIVGFADDIGEDSYNLVLSERRAKNVGVFLKERGVRVDKIYIEGKGESPTNRPRWQNRKVDIIIRVEKDGQ